MDANNEELKARLTNLTRKAIPLLDIPTKKLQVMYFQDTLLGAVQTALNKTKPLHGLQ